jgi:nitrogen-specific signal transduction histidine kinase/ActR/RegA family two-component response regulator
MEDGRQVGYGIMIDVTENKLRDRQIEQAQKMEALGQMTGGVAHDLNNLLTVIVVNLELVARQLNESSQQRRITQAIQAASNGTELARRMLAFARRQVLRPTVLNVSSLVEESLSMLGRTIDATIETRSALAHDIWPVRVDRSALEAAILNLAVNARDAMPDGGTLTITTANVVFDEGAVDKRPEVNPGPYVMLAVSDTGTGMGPEVLARAFEPFFTTKEVGKGTGLGLSMVYGFVKQSNGFVYIDSEQGKGTTVRLYLPRAEIEQLRPESDLSKPAGLPNGNETILVVEDAVAVRTAAVSLLESLGYRVLQAHDGPSALKLVDEHLDIDLVLTDVVMPGGMKGPDLARHVLKRRPDVKLLYMSGYADDAGFRDGVFEPYAELIGKPFQSEELARQVRKVLETRKSPRRKTVRRNKVRA